MRAMTRVAALPVSALGDLRFEKSWRLVSDATALGRDLADRGRELADALYPVIGAPAAGPVKARLVALRRALYSTRRLPAHAWTPEVRAPVPADLAGHISDWQRRHAAREELLADLPGVLEAELAEVNGRLREVLRDRAFRHGLALGSPVLAEELEKWLDGPPGAAPARQPLLRLAKYVARVVAKTSPYSTFTITGAADLRADVPDALRATGDFAWVGVTELNSLLIGRLAGVVSAHPTVVGRLRVRANPSLVVDGDAVRFLGPPPQSSLVTIRRTAALDACLERAAEPSTVDDLSAHLTRLDPQLPAKGVRDFVMKLVRTGTLHLLPPYGDEQTPDHLAGLLDTLADAPRTDNLAEPIAALKAELAGYPTRAEVRDRLAAQRRITAGLAGLIRDDLPRKNLFHENAVFTRPAAELGTTAWAPVFADLRQLRKALALFDPGLPLRRALRKVFVGLFGAGATVRWLDFHHRVGRLMVAGAAAEAGGVDGATLRALAGGVISTNLDEWAALPFARDQIAAIDRVTAAVRGRAPDADGVVRIPATTLADLAGERPFGNRLNDPLACYVQLIGDGRVVVNNITIGYGRGRSRLTRMLGQAGVPIPDTDLVTRDPDGVLVAESDAVYGSNLNLRTRATRHTLDLPYTAPAPGGAHRVPLNDLLVGHDPAGDTLELRSARLGERVRPLHAGMMAEFWLPSPLRHLVEAFGPSPSLLHASVPLFLPRDSDPMTGGVLHLPRVEVGRVALSRACWAMPARELPARRKGEPDAAFWLRFAGWLAAHGVPERFFARVLPAGGQSFRIELKSRKPTFVDAASWHLVADFERAVTDSASLVVLTEALPDLAAAPRYGAIQRVTEIVVEVPGD